MGQSKRITYDSNGNMLIEGIKLGIKEKTFDMTDTFSKLMADIELQFKNAAIDEATYYKNMERLRNTYLEKGTKEWWTYTNKIVKYENDLIEEAEKARQKEEKEAEKARLKEEKEAEKARLKEEKERQKQLKEEEKLRAKQLEQEKKMITEVYSQIAEFALDSLEEIEREKASFSAKLGNVTSEMKTKKIVFVGQGENGQDYVVSESVLENQKAQIAGLKDYYNLLTAVNERGAEFFGIDGFRSFFEMLRGLSVDEGIALSSLLLKENDEGFKEFVGDWQELEATIKSFTDNVFEQDTKKAFDDSISYMEKALTENGLVVPEGFFLSGQLSAEKFGEGFVSEIENILEQISSEFERILPSDNLVKEQGGEVSKSSVFSPVYHLYGSGETISEKLRSAMSQAVVEKLRGGYDVK